MNSPVESKYRLPARIEGLLATLSTSYERKKEVLLQRIVVNAHYTVDEAAEYDNWDGGQTGHLIHLAIPKELFVEAMDSLTEFERRIASDINNIAKCPHESVSAVAIEQKTADTPRWREESGALMTLHISDKAVSEAAERLWEKGYFRVFLSHKAEYKKDAAALKSSLADLGICSFVAHEDIEPTREWQDEIELALSTMDVCVALLTDKFHDSNWTDQEVGVAFGRNVPIVAVRLGKDPYGFIGKFQAIPGVGKKSDDLAVELMQAFLGNERLRQRMASALILRFEKAATYAQANRLMEHIAGLKSLTPDLIRRLENAPKQNDQVKDAFDVKRDLDSVISRLRRRK